MISRIDFMHARDNSNVHGEFHLHDYCEIYFFISGNINYFIEKKVYPLKHGDLLVISSGEVHKPSSWEESPNERIFVNFPAEIASLAKSPDFDLLGCFTGRQKGENNKIPLNMKQMEEISGIFGRMEKAFRQEQPGSDILKLSHLLELLVFINRAYVNAGSRTEEANLPEKIVSVLDYIEVNLESDLSLEQLEKVFYINSVYLSSLFKKTTGTNLHEYIIMKRISRAKEFLLQGCSSMDACQQAGFSDYSNFLRTFKRIMGVTPGRYGKSYI